MLERWESYRRANSDRPEARERELRHLFTLLGPKEGEYIWEVGTGNGYLTFPLAEAVGASGRILTTDVMAENVEDVRRKNEEKGLPIEALLVPEGLPSPLPQGLDAVASIATLHHFDNRRDGTGAQGRKGALKAFFEALRPGGRLVVGDVLDGTISQRYFDAIDDPKYCAPHGHPHDFFTREALEAAAKEAGFSDVRVSVEFVPWQFPSREEAAAFVHTIHNAKCSAEESFALAERMLGFEDKKTHLELGWELFYLTGSKA